MDFTSALSQWQVEHQAGTSIYRLKTGEETIEVMIEGFETRRQDGPFLVGLSGAVTNREQKNPPFFAGSQIAKSLNRPLVSFSDPTMHRANDLALAFYAGNDHVPNLSKVIAEILAALSYHTGRSAVLFGGSGGGFASMNVLRFSDPSYKALVWNPQTILTGYYPRFVQHYVKLAFPDLFHTRNMAAISDPWEIARILKQIGSEPTFMPWRRAGELLYVNNGSDDFHLNNHLYPFLRSGEWLPFGKSSVISPDLNAGVFVGSWGDGHAPLPRPQILECLNGLTEGKSLKNIIFNLEEEVGKPTPSICCFTDKDKFDELFDVSCKVVDGKVRIAMIPHGVQMPVRDVAFQALNGTQIIDERVFSKDTNAELLFEPSPDARIKVIVRDHPGRTLLKVVEIDSETIQPDAEQHNLSERSPLPVGVFVLGSCVSRDILSLPSKTLQLSNYFARSTFGSAFSDKPIGSDEICLQRIKSDFQRRMVAADLQKTLVRHLVEDKYDVLLIDFIDERFALLRDEKGRICTRSVELVSSGLDLGSLFPTRIPSGTNQHFDMWRTGWEKFMEAMKACGRDHKVLVNEVYWCRQTKEGSTDLGNYTIEMIETANFYLEKLYQHVRNTLPASQIMTFDQNLMRADGDHRWGLSPFHYSSNYYIEAAKKVESFSERIRN